MLSASALIFLASLVPLSSGDCLRDVVLVVDGSGSMGSMMEETRRSLLSLTRQLDFGQQRLALVQYSGRYRRWPLYRFGEISSRDELNLVLGSMKPMGGVTATGLAVKRATDLLRARTEGADRPALVLFLTDGFSHDRVEAPLRELFAQPDVVSFVLALSKNHNMPELLLLAGDEPSHVLALDKGHGQEKGDYPDRAAMLSSLSRFVSAFLSCAPSPVVKLRQAESGGDGDGGRREGRKRPTPKPQRTEATAGRQVTAVQPTQRPTAVPPKAGCRVDVVLLIDLSGSVRHLWKDNLRMGEKVIDSLRLGPSRIAAIYFSNKYRSRVAFHLSEYSSAKGMSVELSKSRFQGGITDIAHALGMAQKELKRERENSANKVVVLISDGYSRSDPLAAASSLRSSGAEVFALGPDGAHAANWPELRLLAGSPGRVFPQSDLGRLTQSLKRYNSLCERR